MHGPVCAQTFIAAHADILLIPFLLKHVVANITILCRIPVHPIPSFIPPHPPDSGTSWTTQTKL